MLTNDQDRDVGVVQCSPEILCMLDLGIDIISFYDLATLGNSTLQKG